jgi:hypothetical protein
VEGNPTLKFLKPTIRLTKCSGSKKKVLIVSCITFYDREVEILKDLKGLDVEVYLKAHPGLTNDACYRKIQKEYGFNYITENIFPKVDFVISYDSTLAYEYMAWNIPVYMYEPEEKYDGSAMMDALNKALSKPEFNE